MKKMLLLNPQKRLSARECLEHPVFKTELSHTPLVKRDFGSSSHLKDDMAREERNKKESKIPDRLSSLSPIPKRDRSKMKYFHLKKDN